MIGPRSTAAPVNFPPKGPGLLQPDGGLGAVLSDQISISRASWPFVEALHTCCEVEGKAGKRLGGHGMLSLLVSPWKASY